MTDIILMAVGLVVVMISFLVTGKEKTESTTKEITLTEAQLDECFDQLEPELRRHLMELMEDSRKETVVKADDELGKLADEKQLQLEEYSKTILEKLEQTHQEVVFLYKMLSEKEEKLKEELLLMNQEVEKRKHQIQKELEGLSEKEAQVVKEKKEVQKRERQADELARQMEERKEAGKDQHEIERRLDEMLPPVNTHPKEEEKPKEVPKSEGEAEVPELVRQNRKQQILSMYQSGMSVMDISRELSMGQGEVKLVIDLYQKR